MTADLLGGGVDVKLVDVTAHASFHADLQFAVDHVGFDARHETGVGGNFHLLGRTLSDM